MAYAPRLLHYWGRLEGSKIHTMRRESWASLVASADTAVSLDVRSTPISDVAKRSDVRGSVVHEFAPDSARLTVYRHDPADAPTPINQDDYDIWTNMHAHPKFRHLIVAASTCDNHNLRDFCEENVFFVKRPHGRDHWHTTIPSSMASILNGTFPSI